MLKQWLNYEELVAKIYYKLDREAIVTHNDKIRGRVSNRDRQIDVSIKKKLPGSHDILVVISCKCYKRKPNIGMIDEFYGLLQDVMASKGILICKAGFGTSIKNYARKYNIDLCTVYDLESRDWGKDLLLPYILITYTYKISLGFKADKNILPTPKTFDSLNNYFFSLDCTTRFDIQEHFMKYYNENKHSMVYNKPHSYQINDLYLYTNEAWHPITGCLIDYQVNKVGFIRYITPDEFYQIQHHTKDEATVIFKFTPGENDLNAMEEIKNFDENKIYFPGFYFTEKCEDILSAELFKGGNIEINES